MPKRAAKRNHVQSAEPFLVSLPTLPERVDITVGASGRVVIPASFREALGLKEGDRLMAFLVDGQIELLTPEMGMSRAQNRVAAMGIPADVSLVDELIAERRREAAAELEDD